MDEAIGFAELLDRVRKGTPVKSHSGRVLRGDVFVALPPTSRSGPSGMDFIIQAVERGAAFVVAATDADIPPEVMKLMEAGDPANPRTRLIRQDNTRQALGALAAAHYGTEKLTFPIVGITGTNGKTTVCALLEHLFTKLGKRVGVLGTIDYRWPGSRIDAPLTTPDTLMLHELFSGMMQGGVDVAFMEVSSHALDQERAAGLKFKSAALTNVTQDHLDYHPDMDAYFAAKSRLFESVPELDKPCAVNWDDAYGRRLLLKAGNWMGYGLTENPLRYAGVDGLQGKIVESSVKGLKLLMGWKGQVWSLDSPLVGAFNASNLLTAQAVALSMGVKPKQLKHLESFYGVAGRLERVPCAGDKTVFVDYAHTPDALENVLTALRALKCDRIVTVFGCGGDRDRGKRPKMGQAAAKYSDVCILTSDNPRHEDPLAIMADVKPGLDGCPEIIEEPDRRKALSRALSMLRKGDVLLVAGKGHESYQQVGDVKYPFNDAAVVRELVGCV